MSTSYVLGFMFLDDKRFVVLINKARPEWQKGRLNGVGGHVEKGELPINAMVREFHEETGCLTNTSQWREFAAMTGRDWTCHCFTTTGDLGSVKSITDEPVEIKPLRGMGGYSGRMIENLPWLIHMALDCLEDGRPKFALVQYP